MRQTWITRSRRKCAIALLGGVAAACSLTLVRADQPSTSAVPAPTATPAAIDPTTTCPQTRTTERAPDSYYHRANPLPATADNLDRGRRLFEHDTKHACVDCHGVTGDGNGPEAARLTPPPRNFRCAATMASITDGQLFWIIENGSGDFHRPSRQGSQHVERPARGRLDTDMRGHGDHLTESDIWQLVLYIRTLAAPPTASP